MSGGPASSRKKLIWMPALAAAAILTAGVGLVEWNSPRPAAAPSVAATALSPAKVAPALLADLARFDPPPYHPVVRDGVKKPGEAEFSRAMDTYIAQDWKGCRSALAGAIGKYPKMVSARYYFAICSLLSGQTAKGEATLRQVIADGDTPYLEAAHFYLAKALLARGDTEEAKAELRKTIAMGGAFEPRAAALAARIP